MNLSYIAGFFDGEGCIQFTKCRTSIYPRILITNTNYDILENIKDKFGGNISKLCLRKNNWKQGYNLRISWSNAVDFLDKISPWLILKQKQAQTVFAWDAIRPRRGNKWDQNALKLLTDRMTHLNKKGINNSEDPIISIVKRR